MKRIYPYLILTLISLLSSLILFFSVGGETIYKNNDGPLYIIPAKTFYNKSSFAKLPSEIGLKENYFAAHLPLYPFFIRLTKEIFGFLGVNYLKAMIFVNWLFTIFLVCFFYFFLKKFSLSKRPLILSIVFLFLPRFLVVRTVGAPESLFIFLILLSLYFFELRKYFLAGIFGGLATMTKTPGILLFGAYSLFLFERFIKEKKIDLSYLGIFFIPFGLLAVFFLYYLQYGNFFAYFNSGDNIHLVYPYSVFDFKKDWVGEAWLEDILFYFFLYSLTILNLKNTRYRSFLYFSLVFFFALVNVQHRDIARYSLPLWPMALVALEKFFTSKKFMIIFIILLPAIYLYAVNFLKFNTLLISDWTNYL